MRNIIFLGPGLLESAYQECLYYELKKEVFEMKKQLALPIIYEEIKLDHGYGIDLLAENEIVIEIKRVEAFTDVHKAQIPTYMNLENYKIGTLLNFHVKMLKQGIKRYIY